MNQYISIKLIVIALIIGMIPCVLSAQTVIPVTDFGIVPSDRKSIVSNIKQAIEFCRDKKNVTLKFPKGRYDFWYDGTLPDSVKQSAIKIAGLKNFTIDGGGSEFVFHGRMIAIDVQGCENLTLKNFSIDWDRPLTSQAVIENVTDSYLDIYIDKGMYPFEIEDKKLRFVGEGWKTKVVHYMLFDAKNKEVVTLTRDGALGDRIFESDAEEISPGLVRIYGKTGFIPEKGTYLALYAQRELSGISLYHCKNTMLENIKVFYALGGGILSFMCDGLHFNKVNVEANEAKNRVFSSMADATYFPNCKGVVRIENCKHTGQADDWANFRGTYTQVTKVENENSIAISYKWTRPDKYYNVGDEVCFVEVASMQRQKELYTIKEIDAVNEKEIRLTFSGTLPAYLGTGYVIENMTWTPEVEVVNCVIPRCNRARGILITTPRRALIENNLFQTAGSAILIEGDTDVWYEAGAIRNLTIKNNIFDNCMSSAESGDWKWGEAIISVTPSHKPKSENEEPYHQNIFIENNTFRYYDYNILYARSVKGITFKNNKIEYTAAYPQHGRKVNFYLDGCRNVTIGNNEYDLSYPPRIAELHHMNKKELFVEKEKIQIIAK